MDTTWSRSDVWREHDRRIARGLRVRALALALGCAGLGFMIGALIGCQPASSSDTTSSRSTRAVNK